MPSAATAKYGRGGAAGDFGAQTPATFFSFNARRVVAAKVRRGRAGVRFPAQQGPAERCILFVYKRAPFALSLAHAKRRNS